MADAVTTQVLSDGARNYIAKFTNISDATGEAAVTKITVSGLSANPDGRPCNDLVLQHVESYADGMSVDILWDATTPLICVTVPPGPYRMDYSKHGGLFNNAGSGKTGNVKFTTHNASAGDTYSLVLHFSKCYA